MPPPTRKARGNNGHTGRVPRGWATKTAADVARDQEAHEAKLHGESGMRTALSRPMSLFRLTEAVVVTGKLGMYDVIIGVGQGRNELPAPQRAGAILMFVCSDRVQVGRISTPVYTFMMMGRAQRVVVQDLSLITPV